MKYNIKWQRKKCCGQTARQRKSVCPKADTDTWAELTTWVNASRPFLRKHHAQQFILDHFLPTLIEYTCSFFANSIQTMWLFCISDFSVSNFQFSTWCRQIEIRFRAPTINCRCLIFFIKSRMLTFVFLLLNLDGTCMEAYLSWHLLLCMDI